MSFAANLLKLDLFPAASLRGQSGLFANKFDPLFQQTAQTVKVNWRDGLILFTAIALVVLLTFVGLLLLRKIRLPRGADLHRSPWPASAGKNRPNSTPLLATGTFRQRRRRRVASSR